MWQDKVKELMRYQLGLQLWCSTRPLPAVKQLPKIDETDGDKPMSYRLDTRMN